MTDPNDEQVKALAKSFNEAGKSISRNLAAMGARLDQFSACLRDGDLDALLELCKSDDRQEGDAPPRRAV
jgi:hypothetical protein